MAKAFTSMNFNEEVLNSKEPVLVDFWASWCGPCKMLSPIIDQLSQEAEGFKVGKINVDEEPALAGQYRVMSIPTLILFKDGKPVAQTVGAQPKSAILAMIKANI